MSEDKHCWTFFLPLYTDSFNQTFHIWIHQSIRLAATDFQLVSVEIWLSKIYFWQGFGEQLMNQLKGQMCLAGPMSGLY